MSLLHSSRSPTCYLLHASLDLFPRSHFLPIAVTSIDSFFFFFFIFWTASRLFLPPSSLFLRGFIRSCRCSFELDGNGKLQSQTGVHYAALLMCAENLFTFEVALLWHQWSWSFISALSADLFHPLLIGFLGPRSITPCFLHTKRLIIFFMCSILS